MLGLLWRDPKFAPAMKDPVWRWPLVVLILSLCGLMTYLVEYAAKAAWKRHRIPRRLLNLTGDEEEVLKKYLLEETNVLTWGRFGITTEVLRRDGILHLLESDVDKLSSTIVPMDSHRIDPIAWNYLHAHPDLVGLERTPYRGLAVSAGSRLSPTDSSAWWNSHRKQIKEMLRLFRRD
jgi:hypothetical protein